MVPKSETVVYYSTTLLTIFIFLTDAGAVAANLLDKPSNVSSQDRNITSILSYNTTKLASASNDKSDSKKSAIKFTRREILQLSGSGAGENEVKNKSANDEEDEKTLSQQVADGKYGLIQNEIFTVKPPRLGLISYDVNPEIPKDNANNLGGLEPDDIWLAENHLLVLAGSSLNGLQTRWRPIDNYVAPQRPVKLPANPKIPPPFPVQLIDNGPIEYIKSSNAQSDNLSYNSFDPFFASVNKFQSYSPLIKNKLPEPSYYPLQSQLFKQPPLSPSFVRPPPGAEFLPPYLINANMSDVDEDDPSLYYPPPYDFIYQKDNVSRVPAGPLVPGIVLPPPPNFFSALLNESAAPFKSNEAKLTKFKSGKRLKFTSDEPSIPSTLDTSTIRDDIFNEITYPRVDEDKYSAAVRLTANTPDKEGQNEWIPIPAPKPFFITGEKTPVKSALLVTTDNFPNSYALNNNYYKKTNSLKTNVKKPAAKYLRYMEPSDEPFHSTTPASPRQIISTKSPFYENVGLLHSTTPISSPVQPTIKATYYFYEEPRDDAVPTKPSSTSVPYIPTTIEIDNILPAKQIIPNSKPIPKDEKKRKPITPLIPIYYLAELDNLIDSIEPIRQPYSPPSTPQTESLHSIRQQSTPKPIFEYDYVAANYNDNRPPILPHSTPPSTVFDYNNYYQQPPPHPSQYQNIFNSIAQFSKPRHRTTAKPILYFPNHFLQNTPPDDAFDHLWLPNYNYYGQLVSYPTENPYHAFFTKEEANLVDDNTKEFFTVFGQKIKQRVESTSPLPTPASVTLLADKWKSKRKQNNALPITSTTDNYILYSSTSPAPTHNKNTNKPLSLAGDTNVNYVTPLPPVNPDAEIITATFPSLIRPIVVDDLPADYRKRLNNIINFQQRFQSDQFRSQNYDVPVYRQYNADGSYFNTRQRDPSVPVSLHGDVNVNFRSKFATNPEAEYIGGSSPIEYKQSADSSREYEDERDDGNESRTPTPISLQNDILVNYKNRNRLGTNPDAEYIGAGERDRGSSSETIVSYKYPGVEHGHYYFLTPRETRYKNKNEPGNSRTNVEKLDEYFERKIKQKSSKSSAAERFR